jgi:hypothetical protein
VSTRLTGDVSITCLEVKIQLAADSTRFVLTLSADPGNVWRYNLSEDSQSTRNSRVAFGRTIAPDDRAALRQIAAVLGQGYQPGTVERGLFDMAATDPLTYGPCLCRPRPYVGTAMRDGEHDALVP